MQRLRLLPLLAALLSVLLVTLLVALLAMMIPAAAQETTSTVAPTPHSLEATAAPSEAAAQTAHIRIAHLSPDTPPFNIYINGAPSQIQTIAYPDISGWVEVPVGSYSVAAVPIQETLDAAMITQDLSFAPDAWITVAAVGSLENGTLTAQLIPEDYNSPIPAGQARLTVYHGNQGVPTLDVQRSDGTVLVQGLQYSGAFTVDVPAGTDTFEMTEPGGSAALLTLEDVTLDANTFYFIAATGTPDNPQSVIASVGLAQVSMFIPSAGGTVLDVLRGDSRFSRFVGALDSAGLDAELSGSGPFTIFAPTNSAFAAASLDGATVEQLQSILLNHVVDGLMTANDLRAASSLSAVNGTTITVDGMSAMLDGTAQLVVLDLPASNGVIHGISQVLTTQPGS